MSTASPSDISLVALNRRVHAGLDEHLLAFLEAITALDIGRGHDEFHRFAAGLRRHAAEEDSVVVPAYAALGDHPRGGGPELFTADHDTLRKVLGQCEVALGQLGDAPTRREMVLSLPTLLRLRSVLEHHDSREERFLYVRLDESLDAAAAEPLVQALRRCLHVDVA